MRIYTQSEMYHFPYDIAPVLSSNLRRHKEYRGRGEVLKTTGKIRQIEVTEKSLFYRRRTTYCLPEHT
jgi:hypothetical protein